MKAGELRDIIEKIEKVQKLSLAEISTKADINRSYLSNLLNEDEEKEITDKLYRKFHNAFPAHFPKNNKTNKNVLSETNGKYSPGSDLQTLLRDLSEGNIRREAAVNIIIMTLAELIASKSGKSTAYEHSELLKTIASESDRLLAERKRKG